MNKDEMRIAIAETCGYSFQDEGWRYPEDPGWQKYKAVYRGDGFIGLARPDWIPVPDYPNDLNACAEMEKRLTAGQRMAYTTFLSRICAGSPAGTYEKPVHIKAKPAITAIRATASQRCEAFLRAKGLWK